MENPCPSGTCKNSCTTTTQEQRWLKVLEVNVLHISELLTLIQIFWLILGAFPLRVKRIVGESKASLARCLTGANAGQGDSLLFLSFASKNRYAAGVAERLTREPAKLESFGAREFESRPLRLLVRRTVVWGLWFLRVE